MRHYSFTLQSHASATTRYCGFQRAIAASQYISVSRFSAQPTIFNRRTKIIQRDRSLLNIDASRKSDYLKDEVAERVVDRILVKYSK